MQLVSDLDCSVLNDLDILAAAHEDELCFVVVPSARLRAERIAVLLAMNSVSFRTLGRGTGTIRNANGAEFRSNRLLVLAVPPSSVTVLALFVRLFGVSMIPVRQHKLTG